MKLNERVYAQLTNEPIEVQNLEGHDVEIYILDDYPEVLNEFINKGKFAIWSSVDGKNYKLAIEKGYYEELKELYSKDVNDAWLKFWDECEVISSSFSKKIILPATAAVIVVFLVLMILSSKLGNIGTYVTLALAIIYVFVILVLRKLTTNKINESNRKALDIIKAHMGEDHFNELLERQRNYIDEYYDLLAKKADEEFEREEQARLEEKSKETEETQVDTLEKSKVDTLEETQVEEVKEKSITEVKEETEE